MQLMVGRGVFCLCKVWKFGNPGPVRPDYLGLLVVISLKLAFENNILPFGQ